MKQCVAVWCSALRCVAVRRSVLQCVAVCCSVSQSVKGEKGDTWIGWRSCAQPHKGARTQIAGCCNVLKFVAVFHCRRSHHAHLHPQSHSHVIVTTCFQNMCKTILSLIWGHPLSIFALGGYSCSTTTQVTSKTLWSSEGFDPSGFIWSPLTFM